MQSDDGRRPLPITLADLPLVLLILAGACAVSAAIGFGFAMSGGPAPLGALLAPPALALIAAPLWVLRRRRPADQGDPIEP